jgi:transposase
MRTACVNILHGSLKKRCESREKIEILRLRADLLEGTDRVLMTMYLENGNTFRQMAQLMGVSESTVERQIHKLTERLIDGEYVTCVRNRQMFNQAEIEIAKDYFLNGLSIRKVARKRHWSFYTVRRIIRKIEAIVRQIEKGEKRRCTA